MKAVLSGLLVFLYSCEWATYKTHSPSFIAVTGVELQTPTPSLQKFHAIKDLWVYIDEKYVGTYPIPAVMPILEAGDNKQIRIFPGIRDFGILARPEIYTLLDPVTFNVDLVPGIPVVLHPVFQYKPGLKTWLIEGFETGNQITSDLDSDKMNHLTRTNTMSLEGNFSGLIYNDSQHPITEAGTAFYPFTSTSYLELNFKSSHDFNIGLLTGNGAASIKNYFLVLKATADWKRVYIPLREAIDQNPGDRYQVLVKSEYVSTSSATSVYLDYIKIISLP